MTSFPDRPWGAIAPTGCHPERFPHMDARLIGTIVLSCQMISHGDREREVGLGSVIFDGEPACDWPVLPAIRMRGHATIRHPAIGPSAALVQREHFDRRARREVLALDERLVLLGIVADRGLGVGRQPQLPRNRSRGLSPVAAAHVPDLTL
jgi:hypothetical protein